MINSLKALIHNRSENTDETLFTPKSALAKIFMEEIVVKRLLSYQEQQQLNGTPANQQFSKKVPLGFEY